MEITQYLSLGLSALGTLGGIVSYVLGLRIKQEILENNETIKKEIQSAKDASNAAVATMRAELLREINIHLEKSDDKRERLDREFSEFQASLTDKILNTINGKYVRADLHQQAMANMQERFTSMKEMIVVNMDKIEQGLDRQMLDLKERISQTK